MRPVPRRLLLPRTALLLCGVALLLAACSDRGALSPPTLEPLLVHVDGPWLRDAKGRVVLLRGVNVVYTSGTPPEEQPAPREQDFAFLASLGFNFVRLPVAWASVEPRPGAHDTAFLRDRVDPLLRASSNHGMPVMLSLHQVRWSSCFLGGKGAPPWTCAGADVTQQARPGWGARDTISDMRAARAQCDFYRNAKAPDGVLLRTHYAATWGVLAHYYEQDRRILGFDLLNEPSPGNCFAPDAFVNEVLSPFYAELVQRVRETAAPQAIVYQPAVARGDALLGVATKADPRSIFAPHIYGQTFGAPNVGADAIAGLDAAYARADELAHAISGPLVVGEVGGDAPPDGPYRPATRAFLTASLDELDRRLLSGAIWAFVPSGDIPASGGPGIGNEEDAAVLARPFARRIAGIPREMRFDSESGEFHLRFVDDPAMRPPDPSEIFVPATRRYPRGFVVDVSVGDRWTYDEHNQRVLLYRGAGSTHDLTIRPAPRSGDTAAD